MPIQGQKISYTFSSASSGSVLACGLIYNKDGISGSFEYYGPEDNANVVNNAVVGAYQWAEKFLESDSSSSSIYSLCAVNDATRQGGDLSYQLCSDNVNGYVPTYLATVYSEHPPYGKLNIVNQYYKASPDGSSDFDFFACHFLVESVPGVLLRNQGNNNYDNHYTMDIYNQEDVNTYSPNSIVYNYGPVTTEGTSTASVNVGISAGTDGAGVTASVGYSYSIQDAPVYYQGDAGQQFCKWRHNVDENKDVGSNTYSAQPGISVRVPQSDGLKIDEQYQVMWGYYFLWWWQVWCTHTVNRQGTIY